MRSSVDDSSLLPPSNLFLKKSFFRYFKFIAFLESSKVILRLSALQPFCPRRIRLEMGISERCGTLPSRRQLV